MGDSWWQSKKSVFKKVLLNLIAYRWWQNKKQISKNVFVKLDGSWLMGERKSRFQKFFCKTCQLKKKFFFPSKKKIKHMIFPLATRALSDFLGLKNITSSFLKKFLFLIFFRSQKLTNFSIKILKVIFRNFKMMIWH